MDPFTLIGVAANLAKVIIHLSYTYKLQSTHIGILVDRIISLEKPLEALQRSGRDSNKISEASLRKLISTLEEVQGLIEEHQKNDKTSKTKRFLMGDSKMDDLKLIREKLDSCLMDLQLSITVEEAGKSEQRVHQTARATVDILLNSVQQRATETILKCVQCNLEYRQSENAIGSCKYHTSFPVTAGNWKTKTNCCGKIFKSSEEAYGPDCDGCTRGVHCDFHHTQYPYAAYFIWMRTQLHTNAKETWLKVVDWDFEDQMEKYASFGVSNDNLLFVALGKAHYPLFLQYFDPYNMPQTNGSVIGNMMTIAMRGSDIQPGEEDVSTHTNRWIVDALWTLDSKHQINGIRLSANSLSSKFPVIKEFSFSLNPMTKGDLRVLSFSAAPNKAVYNDPLPEVTSKFTPFPDSIAQQPPLEPAFETQLNGTMQVRLKKSAPCQANPDTSGFQSDTFVMEFLVMNLSQGATLGSSSEERMVVLNMLKDGKMAVEEAIKLLSTLDSSPHQHGALTFVECRARFYYKNRWVEPLEVRAKLKKDDKFIPAVPFELPPRGASKVVVEAVIECADKKKAASGWFYRAFVSRLEPIIIEVIFEEMSGQTVSIQSQFGNPAHKFPELEPDKNLFWLHVDDVDSWQRQYMSINRPSAEHPTACFEICISGSSKSPVSFKDLMRWGYAAAKTNSSVYEITEIGSSNNLKIHGLVDTTSNVVAGFKFHISTGDSFNEGIWMIPEDLYLNSRKQCIGEDVEQALWQMNSDKPNQPPPTQPKDSFGSRSRLDKKPAGPLPPTPSANGASLSPSPASSPSISTPPTKPPPPSSTTQSPAPKPDAKPPAPSPLSHSTPVLPHTPAPSHPLSASAPTSAPISPTLDVSPAALAAVTQYTPPPLNQDLVRQKEKEKAAELEKEKELQLGRIAQRCNQCSFGMKKDQCIKCKSNVLASPPPPAGLICSFCRMQTKGRCYACSNVLIGGKGVPTVLCSKCHFSAKDKCIKCGKMVPAGV